MTNITDQIVIIALNLSGVLVTLIITKAKDMAEAKKTIQYIATTRGRGLHYETYQTYQTLYSYENCYKCLEKMGFSIDSGEQGDIKSRNRIYQIGASKSKYNQEDHYRYFCNLMVENKKDSNENYYLIVNSIVKCQSGFQDSNQAFLLAQQLVDAFCKEFLQ